MVKQRNIFTGKVDILTDAGDDQGKVQLAYHALRLTGEAGRIVKARQAVTAQAPKVGNQVNLF